MSCQCEFDRAELETATCNIQTCSMRVVFAFHFKSSATFPLAVSTLPKKTPEFICVA